MELLQNKCFHNPQWLKSECDTWLFTLSILTIVSSQKFRLFSAGIWPLKGNRISSADPRVTWGCFLWLFMMLNKIQMPTWRFSRSSPACNLFLLDGFWNFRTTLKYISLISYQKIMISSPTLEATITTSLQNFQGRVCFLGSWQVSHKDAGIVVFIFVYFSLCSSSYWWGF